MQDSIESVVNLRGVCMSMQVMTQKCFANMAMGRTRCFASATGLHNHTCGVVCMYMLHALQLKPSSVCCDSDNKRWQALLENAVTVVALSLPCR